MSIGHMGNIIVSTLSVAGKFGEWSTSESSTAGPSVPEQTISFPPRSHECDKWLVWGEYLVSSLEPHSSVYQFSFDSEFLAETVFRCSQA